MNLLVVIRSDSVGQFTLQFTECNDTSTDAASTVNVKTSGIASKCNKRRGNMCYVLSGIPEPASCPCTYFVTSDKDAIKKFNDLCLVNKCKGQIKKHKAGEVTYWDLLALDVHRGGTSG